MARPKRELTMARCAHEALLAAVEIYNRPKAEYKEQTVAFLLVNAWEVLIKARIVQQNGGKIEAIYRRERNSKRYARNPDGEILTIDIRGALNHSGLPQEVISNINGVIKVRNQATHLGVLVAELKQSILEFSTASVQNFAKTYANWFQESIDAPYFLPLGFVGTAQAVVANHPVRQKQLLKELSDLANSQESSGSDYSVVMHVDVRLNRGLSGGGNIGLTNDPNVLKVSITDDEALQTFPTSYNELVDTCRSRYSNFKQNKEFHSAMKQVHEDPKCTYVTDLTHRLKKAAIFEP
jgi:hypothetical protein